MAPTGCGRSKQYPAFEKSAVLRRVETHRHSFSLSGYCAEDGTADPASSRLCKARAIHCFGDSQATVQRAAASSGHERDPRASKACIEHLDTGWKTYGGATRKEPISLQPCNRATRFLAVRPRDR